MKPNKLRIKPLPQFPGARWILSLLIYLGLVGIVAAADVDTEILAGRIAKSLGQLSGPQYNTLAISRIKKKNSSMNLNINELMDYTNVNLVKSQRFRVTDRSKLQLILKEQRVQMSEFVTPSEYKELGRVLGVQLFVYGTLYEDALLLKAIDVQTSVIVWADAFALKNDAKTHNLLSALNTQLMESLIKDKERLKEDGVKRISFWNLDITGKIPSDQILDYFMVALAKENHFSIVDRENLQLIFQEQKLNQAVFIEESQARKLGELYGVDGFIYGSFTLKTENSYIASLKMMNIYNGTIAWADLLKFEGKTENVNQKLINPFDKKIKERMKKKGQVSGMVALPGDSFIMGSDDPMYNSSPSRSIRLKPFMFDLYEVSNSQYQAFVQQSAHRIPAYWKDGQPEADKLDMPVIGVSWEDAKLYCQFVGKRLPTEMEWEFALRGSKGRTYSWNGPSFSPSFAITKESNAKGPYPVQTMNKDITPEGIYHLVGNVREFVSDYFRPYPGSNRTEDYLSNERVVRGSSWAYSAYEAAGFFRGHTKSNLAWPDVGFRCAMDQ